MELTAGDKSLTEQGIFHGEALSPLLFVAVAMLFNHILREYADGYKLTKSQEKINHELYMDDIKLFAKNEKELETLKQAVRIYMTEGMELPNQEKIRTLGEKETYKYLRILEANIIKQVEMKEKIKKYPRITRKLFEIKPYSRNLIKEINTWAVSLVRYSGTFLKLTRQLKQMNQRRRIPMTMLEALNSRDDVDCLYLS